MTERQFTETYMPLGDTLYRVAFYILESAQDAEDAVQDLYIKLWNSRDSLDSVINPKAYSITLLRNACIDQIRRSSGVERVELPEMAAESGDAQHALEKKESLARVIEAMGHLSESERTVLRMRVFENMTYEDISLKTGMKNLTLRVLLSRARRRIKDLL